MKNRSIAIEGRWKNTALRDLVIIAIVAIFVAVLASVFDAFEEFLKWSQAYEEWEIDEIVTILVVLAFAFGVYSWRRWRELGREITWRKRVEQELKEKNEQLDAQNEELQVTEEELRATNEELQAANDELRETQEQLIRSEKLAAIGQLASGVGHELRNPLGAIKNAVFYVRRKITGTDIAEREPRVMQFLEIMDGEVDAANKVITDLLDYSRVVKPTTSLARIDSIIEDALHHTPFPENIELIKDTDTNLSTVMVDADQIRQVFVNIILNAQQAMPEGGRFEVRAYSNGEFLEVSFADSGDGIPQSVIKKIFDPLFTTKAKGIGLGLAVCKSILEKHGGDIKVESEEGKGATFTVYLPVK